VIDVSYDPHTCPTIPANAGTHGRNTPGLRTDKPSLPWPGGRPSSGWSGGGGSVTAKIFTDGTAPRRGDGRASLAIDNLRAGVILLVLAFHSSLAYLAFLPRRPFAFTSPPFQWRAFPIIDAQRSIGLELFCAWQDVFLMTLFFFLSGLFVWPSLKRKGVKAFVADRCKRLGLPFAMVVGLLMPIAQYPTYLQTAGDPAIGAYVRAFLRLPLWPCGPMWFLWLLLAADLIAAGLYAIAPDWATRLRQLSGIVEARPVRYFGWLLATSALAYVPLALAFTADAWGQFGPFALQLSRPLHYAVYFFAGAGLGAFGIERGLFSSQGALVEHWRIWLTAALGSFALWLGVSALVLDGQSPAAAGLQVIDDLSFVLACFCNCFGVLALALRFAARRRTWLDPLKENAFGMYLVHYVFVIWLQLLLLPLVVPALVKAGVVFAGTLLASWVVTAGFRRLLPIAAGIFAGGRATAATSS
jgi:glucans biosynthesis protein C